MSKNQSQLLAIMDQANRIASMTSLQDLLGQMLDLIIEVSGSTNGTLYLLDQELGELIFMVVRGEPEDQKLVGKRIKENVGIVGSAIQQAKTIVINDLESDPRWYREINLEKTNRLRNAITLPLLLQGKPIGAVQIFNFVHAELELLQLLGNRMASEVDKVLLLEKARSSNQRLQTLVDILGHLGAILDHDKLLDSITENVLHLLDADRSSIFLVDSTTDKDTHMLSRSSQATMLEYAFVSDETTTISNGFTADSTVSVPLRARPIVLGKERNILEERMIGNLMALDKHHGKFDSEDSQLLGILASQVSTILQITTLFGQANDLFLDFTKVLVATIDAKDPYTKGHSKRVSDISVNIAQKFCMEGDLIHDIRIGSLLHDIGKIHVPDHLLTKPGRLTEDEYEMVKTHPGAGYKIMKEVRLLSNILPAIVEHHERLDGSGYPFGLSGDQISIMGRIVSVADVFDAISSERPYRKAMNQESAIEHLKSQSNICFDGDCIDALAEIQLENESY